MSFFPGGMGGWGRVGKGGILAFYRNLFCTIWFVTICAYSAMIQKGWFSRKKDSRYSKSKCSCRYHDFLSAIWLPFQTIAPPVETPALPPQARWFGGMSLLSGSISSPVKKKKGNEMLTWPGCHCRLCKHLSASLPPSLHPWGRRPTPRFLCTGFWVGPAHLDCLKLPM